MKCLILGLVVTLVSCFSAEARPVVAVQRVRAVNVVRVQRVVAVQRVRVINPVVVQRVRVVNQVFATPVVAVSSFAFAPVVAVSPFAVAPVVSFAAPSVFVPAASAFTVQTFGFPVLQSQFLGVPTVTVTRVRTIIR